MDMRIENLGETDFSILPSPTPSVRVGGGCGIFGKSPMGIARIAILVSVLPLCGGCAVVAVADAAVTVAATTVKVGAKVVGAAVDVVIPDDDKKDKDR